MITVTQSDGQPLFTFCDQDGDLVLTVFSPDIDIVVPSADELLQSRKPDVPTRRGYHVYVGCEEATQ